MDLFSPRLLRSFAIGFVLGAIGVATLALAERTPGAGHVVPSAIAAPAR